MLSARFTHIHFAHKNSFHPFHIIIKMNYHRYENPALHVSTDRLLDYKYFNRVCSRLLLQLLLAAFLMLLRVQSNSKAAFSCLLFPFKILKQLLSQQLLVAYTPDCKQEKQLCKYLYVCVAVNFFKIEKYCCQWNYLPVCT